MPSPQYGWNTTCVALIPIYFHIYYLPIYSPQQCMYWTVQFMYSYDLCYTCLNSIKVHSHSAIPARQREGYATTCGWSSISPKSSTRLPVTKIVPTVAVYTWNILHYTIEHQQVNKILCPSYVNAWRVWLVRSVFTDRLSWIFQF